jgi:hypothetical protein
LGRPLKEWWCDGIGVRSFIGALVVVGLRCTRKWCRRTAVRLACGRSALSSVAVRVAGLVLNRNVSCEALIVVSLHGHALRRLSIARLGISVELLMQKDKLLVELAPWLS